MYTEEDKVKIANLLRDCQQFMNPGKLKKIPGNYAQLKEAALLQELAQEVQKLTALFSADAGNEALLKQSFRKLCAEREEQNQGTCMSFTALPEGICNGLYLEIATVLFKPRDFGELVAILLPGMKASLTAELVFSQTYASGVSRKAEENLDLALKEEPLAAFAAYPAQRSTLTQVVTGDSVVFNLESIANVPLRLREQFHRSIVKYPALNNKIYKHNDDLHQLFFDLELLNKHGATPDEMLQHLSDELLRAGTRFTGNVNAASSVTGPCSQFRHYLDQLPSDMEEKLVAMRNSDGADSLAKVLEHLANANCVEEAAGRIKKIRDNPANKDLLKSHPGTTKEQEYKIKKKYDKAIEVTGFENTNKLPEKLKRELIRNIRIKSAHDYIDLLLNLPAEEYLSFLTHASIACDPPLPAELASATKMLNTEQTTALFDALFAQKDKFGGNRAIIFFAVKSNITVKVLQAVPESERHSLIKETDGDNTSLLALAAQNNNPEIWKLLWDQLCAQDRLELLNKGNNFNGTAMFYAAANNNPEILRSILNFLPQPERLASLQNKNTGTESPLDAAIRNSNPALLQTIRESLSEEDYLKAVTGADSLSLVHKAVDFNNLENLKSLIAYVKEHDLMCVLSNRSDNKNILHRAAVCGNLEIARILLASLTEQEIKTLLSEKEGYKNTPFDVAAAWKNFDIFMLMMGHLTDNERFAVLSSGNSISALTKSTPEKWGIIWGLLEDKNKFASLFLGKGEGLWPLHEASKNRHQDIWQDLWGALTAEQRAGFVKSRLSKTKSLLHDLAEAGHFQAWTNVWELYSQEERLAALAEKSADGGTILHCASQNHNLAVSRAILLFLSANHLLTALNIKRDDGVTPLHAAIIHHNPSFLHALLELIPETDRLTALKQMLKSGNSALHLAANDTACWRVLWQLLPAGDRLSALKEKNGSDNSPLHVAIRVNPPLISIMLSPLSQQQRMLVLSERNSQNHTPLYAALENTGETCMSIWEYMPEPLRLSAIKEKEQGSTLLHLAVSKYRPELVTAILKALPEQDRLAALSGTNADGDTPLHSAASCRTSEMLSDMLDYLPHQHRLTAISVKNKDGDSVLYSARTSTENFFILLQTLSDEDRLKVLEDKNNAGLNAVNAAIKARNEHILIKLQELLPLNELSVLLKAKDNKGNNSLHVANDLPRMNGTCLRILRMLPEDERLLMLKEKNESGDTPLHFIAKGWRIVHSWSELWELFTDKAKLASLFAVHGNNDDVCPLHLAVQNGNTEIWHNVWDALTAQQKAAFINKKTTEGTRLLHFAAQASCLAVWREVWDFHSEQERLIALAEKSASGLTILHWAAQNHDEQVTRDIIQVSSTLLTEKRNNGNTPLHTAVVHNNSPVLQVLLEWIPTQERLTHLKQQNESGHAVLHLAACQRTSGCWEVIWRSLPAHDRLNALTEKNKYGQTFFHALINTTSFSDPAFFPTSWNVLSEEERLGVLNDKDRSGNNLLHYIFQYNEMWSAVLKSLPLQLCVQVLRASNRLGNTPLHTAAKKEHGDFATLLSLVPAQARLILLTEINRYDGDTPLHAAARKKDMRNLYYMLASLSRSERLQALKAKNRAGSTVLHYAAETRDEGNIEYFLAELSQEERLLLVTEKNKFGQTPLDRAAKNKNFKLWSKLWSLLTEEEQKIAREMLNQPHKSALFQPPPDSTSTGLAKLAHISCKN